MSGSKGRRCRRGGSDAGRQCLGCAQGGARRTGGARRSLKTLAAGKGFEQELRQTASSVASPGRGILAMDESNGTCGKRLDAVGVENSEENRRRYRELLVTAPMGEYVSGAILFEETLYQKDSSGKPFVDCLKDNGVLPGIKVDKGLVPLPGSNGESCTQGLDGLASRAQEYYKQGAKFAKWRGVINITAGPSWQAINETTYSLARYATICQDNGLVPIVEPEVLIDGEHDIDTTLEVQEHVWATQFKHLSDLGALFEGILLKPAMVIPGADNPNAPAPPEQVAEYTLSLMKRRVPPAVPGIHFLSGGMSEVEATLNLNAMNQQANPWHVSFSYARALQNTVIKTWAGDDNNFQAAQQALLRRAKANSMAQLGKYDSSQEEDEAAAESNYVKGYSY